MKCIHCGAPTMVKETREQGRWKTMRRHQCFNGCATFKTYEIPETAYGLGRRRAREAFWTYERRCLAWKRDAAIKAMLAKGVKGAEAARHFNVSQQWVSLLKKRVKVS